MKITLVLPFLIVVPAYSKEDCRLESLGLSPESEQIEKYFYTGTCHYRNKDYELAVKNWEHLPKLTDVPAEFEELKIHALNNLGYMNYFGYGTEKNQEMALELWTKAILLGHEEAEYHLCHAYGDREEPTYDLIKAKTHCKKARLIYKGMDRKDDEILQQIEKYLDELGSADK